MRTNLDVMRALAVSFVVWSHLVGALWGVTPNSENLGRLGVLIFFVHTSIVLVGSLQRLHVAHTLRAFYVRRAFRIYPLSIIAIIVAALLHVPWIVWRPEHVHYTASSLLASLLLVQNLTGHAPVLGVIWTLCYEIQMYAVLPFIDRLSRLRSNAWLLAVWLAAAIVCGLLNDADAPVLGVLVAFAPCFIAGIFSANSRLRGDAASWLWPGFLALIAVLYCWFDDSTGSITQGLEYQWLTCGLLAVAIPLFKDMAVSWFTQAARVVARYSYGIYLAHTLVLWAAFVVFHGSPVLQWTYFTVGMILFPVAAYHLVERPMIDLGVWLTSEPAAA